MLAPLLLFASYCVGSVNGTAVDTDEAVKLVLAGDEQRWSQVSSFKATITRTTWNSPESQRRIDKAAKALRRDEKQVAATDSSLQLSIVKPAAKIEVSQSVICKGDRFRFNGSLVTPAKEERDDVFILSDDEMTIYDPTYGRATICPADTATGAIRNLCSLAFQDERESIPALLENSEVTAAEYVEFGGKRMLRLMVTHQDVERVLMFDPARDYVLERMWVLNPDHTTISYASIVNYEKVSLETGKVWMPTSSQQYVFWEKGVTLEEVLPDNWIQRVRYDVEDLQVNVDIPDDVFHLDFPVGTQVSNLITGQGRVIP